MAERGRSGGFGRGTASLLLAVLGSTLLLLGGILLYAREQLLDADAFADRAETALDDERVSLAISQPVVDAVIDNGPPQLVNARPLIESGVNGALGSGPVEDAFREAVKVAHEGVLERDRQSLLLNVANAALVATDAIKAISPQLAEQLPDDLGRAPVEVVESDVAIAVFELAQGLRGGGLVLPPLAVLLLVGSIAVAPNRRAGLVRVSASIAFTGAVALAVFLVGRTLVVNQFDDPLLADAARASWDAFLGDLELWFLFGAGFGIVLTAAATFGEQRADLLAPARRAAAALRWRPEAPLARVGWALGLGAISLMLLLHPEVALAIVTVAAGAWGLYVAFGELMLVLAPPVRSEGEPASLLTRLKPARAAAAFGVIVIAALLLVVGGGDDGGADARPTGPVEACNGYAELCDKRIDEVTFAATHNAMSAAENPGWFAPNQRFGFTRQLDDGIRALLIDTHYGTRRGTGRGAGEVITDLSREDKTRDQLVEQLGPEGVERAEQLIGNLAFEGTKGPSEPFLCHVLCELGATELVDGLTEIRTWLDRHPDEFLIIFIEDVVSPKETADAFEQSGLLPYAYVHKSGTPFPTLRELIEDDKRILVMAENDGGGGAMPWYAEGFEITQETPYTFHSAEELAARSSCRPNRGGTDKPLFQLNNWIEKLPRDPDLAARVNDRRALLRRARMCRRIRGLKPTLIPVDFYDRGDVFGVANRLNGLDPDAKPTVRESG